MSVNSSDQYKLRLPPGLKDQIKADAKRNGRSMNAEIIARITGGPATPLDQYALAVLTRLFNSHARHSEDV